MCALIIFPFRKLPAKKLIAIGVLFMAFKMGSSAVEAWRQKEWWNLAAAADTAEKRAGNRPNRRARRSRRWPRSEGCGSPAQEDLEKDARQWRAGPWAVIGAQANKLATWQGLPLYDPMFADIWSMMFIGMGLFKMGVFSAARSFRFYAWMAALGFLVGIPLNAYDAWLALRSHFDRLTILFTNVAYDVERLPMALADMAVLMMLCQARTLPWLTGRLAAIGQMALSNYILQSIVCSFVFTGYGLPVRKAGAVSVVLRGGRLLGGVTGGQPHLAAALPVRAVGVVLAVADLLEEAADANGRVDGGAAAREAAV